MEMLTSRCHDRMLDIFPNSLSILSSVCSPRGPFHYARPLFPWKRFCFCVIAGPLLPCSFFFPGSPIPTIDSPTNKTFHVETFPHPFQTPRFGHTYKYESNGNSLRYQLVQYLWRPQRNAIFGVKLIFRSIFANAEFDTKCQSRRFELKLHATIFRN